MKLRLKSTLLFTGVLMLSQSATLSLGQDVRTVALQGDATGISGATFDTFDFGAVLNNNGEVAFNGTIDGPGIVDFTNDSGVWSEGGGGGLGLVSRAGDAAPGTGVVFAGFGIESLIINDSGHTAFITSLSGSGVNSDNDNGIWSEGQGNGLALVARAGDAVPGIGTGITHGDFRNRPLRFNNQGRTAIRGLVLGGGSNFDTVFTENAGGSLSVVARAGDTAPGLSVPWTDFNFSEPAFNDNSQVAFDGGVFAASFQQFGVWRGTPGNVSAVAFPNSQPPGTPAGVTFDAALSPSMNNNGQVAFFAIVGGANASTNTGIWTEGGGNGLALVAREGSAATGVASGIVYNTFDNPIINNSGDTVFRGSLIGTGVDATNDHGIWKDPASSSLELVARDGQQAAGTQNGVVFDLDFNTRISLSLNSAGQIAFLSSLAGSGVNASNDRGIWAQDLAGNLQLIAREGDLLEVFDDQLVSSMRTINLLSFSNPTSNSANGDGRPSSFNDSGQLVFYASFTDGSEGIFVSNIVAVPEPGSGVVIALTMVLLARRRRS